MLLAAKVSAPSTSSIGTGQKDPPTLLTIPVRKVLKQDTKLGLLKLAPSISKPTTTFWLVQGPAVLVNALSLAMVGWQLKTQVTLIPMDVQAGQLYLYPFGYCIFKDIDIIEQVDPNALELEKQPWKSEEFIAERQITGQLMLVPAKFLPKVQPLVWQLEKSATDSTFWQSQRAARRRRRQSSLFILIILHKHHRSASVSRRSMATSCRCCSALCLPQGKQVQLCCILVQQYATCEQFSATWQYPLLSAAKKCQVQLPTGKELLPMKLTPPIVAPEVDVRLSAWKYMQQSPLRSLIITLTSPLLLMFMSLLRMSNPQLQQQSNPQIFMLSDSPGLTTALSINGQFITAKLISKRAEYSVVGAKAGDGPRMF